MKYIIANKVIYDSDAASLISAIDGIDEEKKITKTANRILSILIESHGKVVEREYFLEQVWESYGLASSNGSLNQYISILRKTLASLTDIDDIIISVPKVGFLISQDIEVTPQEVVEGKPKSPPLKKMFPWPVITLLIAIALTLFIDIYVFNRGDSNPRYKNDTELFAIGRCQVKSWGNTQGSFNEIIADVIGQLSPYINEQCSNYPALIYVNLQKNILHGEEGIAFISFCPLHEKEIIYCDSSYYYNWRLK